MQVVDLGKITVSTAGTPTPITAALITAAGGILPASGLVYKFQVCADPAMAGTLAYVKGAKGNVLKALPKPSGGYVACYCAVAPEGGNAVDPKQFSLDVAANGDGAYVSVWID